jgi:hypothetical protein
MKLNDFNLGTTTDLVMLTGPQNVMSQRSHWAKIYEGQPKRTPGKQASNNVYKNG